ncbi:Lysosomal protective protein-like protein [Aphelenchoides besseyi]|nr:Lysosomal protective protein-like protein [Aphelenchoides besseyi]
MRLSNFLTVLSIFTVSLGFSDTRSDHRLSELPGWKEDELPSAQFTGYLDADYGRYFFYWFVESEHDPANDPLIFWFSGGPGCSSLETLFNGNGPFLANDDGTLRKNEHSWTKFASIVYLNSPDAIGFSYALNESNNIGPHPHFSDNGTAIGNYRAVQSFFKIHQNFSLNSLYLFAESYGGLFLTSLSEKLIDDENINLKGLGIANGVIDEDIDLISKLQFFYYHGFIDDSRISVVYEKCGKVEEIDDKTRFCYISQVYEMQQNLEHVNLYNVYDKCHENANPTMRCLPASNATVYLNLPDVQKAIGVSSKAITNWTVCEKSIYPVGVYERPFTAHMAPYYRLYYQQIRSAQPFLKKAIEKNIDVLLYYGDSDAICPFLTAQSVAEKIGQNRSTKRTWPSHDQIYGFITSFDHLHFATIIGGSHVVSNSRPAETTVLIEAFLNRTLNVDDKKEDE